MDLSTMSAPELMQLVLERVADCDELPHEVDDTTIDRIVGAAKIHAATLRPFLIKRAAEYKPIDREVPTILLTRMVQGIIKDDKDLAELKCFFSGLESTLISDDVSPLLQCTILNCLASTRQVCYSNEHEVVEWCLDSLGDSSRSLFVHASIVRLLEVFSESILSSPHISSVKEVYERVVKMIRIENFASTCRYLVLISSAAEQLEPAAKQEIQRLIQETSGDIPESVYPYIIAICESPNFVHELTVGKWTNERNRIRIISFWMASPNSLSSESKREFALSIAGSKLARLDDIVPLVCYLEAKTIPSQIDFWIADGWLANRRLASLSALCSFIEALSLHRDFTNKDLQHKDTIKGICNETMFQKLFRAVEERIKSPSESSHQLIAAFRKTFGPEVFENPEVVEKLRTIIKQGLTSGEWEARDNALEILLQLPATYRNLIEDIRLFISDESPYVRASALRILAESDSGIQADMLESILGEEISPEPRLIALRHLLSDHHPLPVQMSVISRTLSALLDDYDMQLFSALTPLLGQMMKTQEYVDEVRAELTQWKEDPQIGSAVRALLGYQSNGDAQNEAENGHRLKKVVEEFIAALDSHCLADEVIDCY